MVTEIKICGLTQISDLEKAVDLAVDAVGCVFSISSPRSVTLESPIVAALAEIKGVERTAVWGAYESVGELPMFDAIQAFDPWLHEGSQKKIVTYRIGKDKEILQNTGFVTADGFADGQEGGTGVRVDFDAYDAWRKLLPVGTHVTLAGGLNPDNVAEAIVRFRPNRVDVSTGIESTPGIKDHGALLAFVDAVRATHS